jgi:hypothetical protein
VRSLRHALQDLAHLNVRPPAASGCSDLPGVELASDGIEARMARRLQLSNQRQDIGRELTRPRLEGVADALYCAGRIGPVPSRVPRALAAARAALVRSEVPSRSWGLCSYEGLRQESIRLSANS